MNVGTKTHFCDGSRGPGAVIFGRIINLYVHRNGKWLKIGSICSNCGYHWINGKACGAQLSNGRKAQQA